MVKVSLIFLIIAAAASAQENPSCTYNKHILSFYDCELAINNPNGFDGFESIEGEHYDGKTYDDVNVILFKNSSETKNFPRIICDTFENVEVISISDSIGLSEIGINSFVNCKKLLFLTLISNELKQIDANAFENNENLAHLYISRNQISQLPENIFKPLKNLQTLSLYSNKIEVVYANWFGYHPLLEFIDFDSNEIYAVDERVFEVAPNLRTISFSNNICTFTTINIENYREILEPCFANFRELVW